MNRTLILVNAAQTPDDLARVVIDKAIESSRNAEAAPLVFLYGDWTDPEDEKFNKWLDKWVLSCGTQSVNFVDVRAYEAIVQMTVDAMELCEKEDFTRIVLVGGDADFSRLAYRLKKSGTRVEGIGSAERADDFLASCDFWTSYEMLRDRDE